MLNCVLLLFLAIYPSVAIGPTDLRLTLTVEPNERARSLSVEMDAENFYRQTTIPMDGKDAPKRNTITWHGVPSGEYTVIARLLGTSDTLLESVTRQIIIR